MRTRPGIVLGCALAWLAGAASAQDRPAAAGADEQARALLGELVAIRSAKGHGQVPAVAALLAERFRQAGFADEDIRVLESRTDDGEPLAALIVRYRTDAANPAPPIAVLGHMDVVDADPARWDTDPFVLTARDGWWQGRGSADNKGPIAAIASTLIQLKRSGWMPQRDLLLVLSGDEESGSRTTVALTRDPWLQEVEFAINGDTGGGQVDANGGHPVFDLQVAEKTSVSFKLSSRNRGGHSSEPRADNALYEIADAIKAVQALRFPVRIDEANRAMVQGLARDRDSELGQAFSALLADTTDAAARAVVERYPQDAHVLWTTCVPTLVSGGSARNALPQGAELIVHCRIFPGQSIESVQAALVQAVANPAVRVEVDAARGSSPPSPVREDVMAAAGRAFASLYPGAEVRASMSSGGSDGRYFRQAGIPTYGVNPMAVTRPDDDRAHGIDERLRIESFDKALPFWDAFLRELAALPAGQTPHSPRTPQP